MSRQNYGPLREVHQRAAEVSDGEKNAAPAEPALEAGISEEPNNSAAEIEPTRPTSVRAPAPWTERQDMPSQQASALDMVKAHSHERQSAADAYEHRNEQAQELGQSTAAHEPDARAADGEMSGTAENTTDKRETSAGAEITDTKAARIAQIRADGEKFETAEQARQADLSNERSGRD